MVAAIAAGAVLPLRYGFPKGLHPCRIVSLVPSWTEALFHLGLGPKVVGVTDWCWHPAEGVRDLPKVGGTKNARVKDILELEPDLVIACKEENLRRHIERLDAAGARVWVTDPCTVTQATEEYTAMAHLAGPPGSTEATAATAAAAVAAAHVAAAAAVSSTLRVEGPGTLSPSRPPPPRVFCPIWKDPWMAVGGDTYAHDLLELCGARNVFADHSGGRYPKLTDGEMVDAAPEVILLPSEPYEFTEEHREELLGLAGLLAAKNNRIHLVDGTLLTWYGPRIPRAITVLRPLLTGQAEAVMRDGNRS